MVMNNYTLEKREEFIKALKNYGKDFTKKDEALLTLTKILEKLNKGEFNIYNKYGEYFEEEIILTTLEKDESRNLWIDKLEQYRLGVKDQPMQIKKILRRWKIIPSIAIDDITVVIFLYLAGLISVCYGVFNSDTFFAILGALGITGATFHVMKE